MQILLTGGTGHIGSAVLPALLDAGHDVVALARSDASAQRLQDAGARPVRGELTDAAVLRDAAAAADAAIHLGSPGDETSADTDRAAAAAMQEGLGDGKPYVHTGGAWVYGNTAGVVGEDAPYQPPAITAWRRDVEDEVLARGHAVLVLPGIVYGGRPGLLELTFGPGDDGRGRFPGDGSAHVTAVHADDCAALYVLALDAHAGTRLLAVTENVPVREVAEALGRDGEAAPEPAADFEARLGPLAEAMALDQQLNVDRARGLGWAPAHTDVLGELRVSGGS